MNTKDRQLAIVTKALNELGEHFDSVQIFTTVAADNGDGTTRISKGCGDYFARYGAVTYWLTVENQSARNEAPKSDE